MFSHIMVGANDLDVAKKFYDAAFAAIGIASGKVDPNGRIFYMAPTGTFVVTTPINGEPATAANGGTIGFAVDNPELCDKWHAAGLANGGTTCEDPPGIRETGLGKLYLAYLRDPTGNKLCTLMRMN